MNKKNFFPVLLAAIILAGNAWAEIVASGNNCGPKGQTNCSWTLDSDGKLTISGTGEMRSSWSYKAEIPWYGKETDVTSIEIQEGITTTAHWLADGFSNLQSVSLPSTLTTIGTQSFQNFKPTSIDIPASVTKIEGFAFYGGNLTEVNIPKGVTAIGDYAFFANKIAEVIIPEGVTTIGSRAFSPSESNTTSYITNLVIPDSVTSIGTAAFKYVKPTDLTIRSDKIQMYIDALGDFTRINKLYCSDGAEACKTVLANLGYSSLLNFVEDAPIKTASQGNNASASNRLGKRIYTVEEAAAVSKDTGNTIKLRYK